MFSHIGLLQVVGDSLQIAGLDGLLKSGEPDWGDLQSVLAHGPSHDLVLECSLLRKLDYPAEIRAAFIALHFIGLLIVYIGIVSIWLIACICYVKVQIVVGLAVDLSVFLSNERRTRLALCFSLSRSDRVEQRGSH